MLVFTADRIFCSRWRSLLERAKRWNPSQQGRRLPVRLSKALSLQGSYPHFYQFQLFYIKFLYYFLLIKSEPFGFNIMLCLLVFRLMMICRSIPKPDASAAAALPLNFADAIPSTLPSLTSKSFKMLRLRKNLVSDSQLVSDHSKIGRNEAFPVFCLFSCLSYHQPDWGSPGLMGLSLDKCQSFACHRYLCHRYQLHSISFLFNRETFLWKESLWTFFVFSDLIRLGNIKS